jgi:hypothetical protein
MRALWGEAAMAESALRSRACLEVLWMPGKEMKRLGNELGSNHQRIKYPSLFSYI